VKSQIKVTQSDRPKNKKVIQAELGSDATKQFFSKRREFTAHNFDFFEINILNNNMFHIAGCRALPTAFYEIFQFFKTLY
jgi:hypothetical protein